MSIMIVSDVSRFSVIIGKLSDPGLHNIHCYNSRMPQGLAGPVLSLLSFVDLVIFDDPSYRSSSLSLLRRVAKKMNVRSEEGRVG